MSLTLLEQPSLIRKDGPYLIPEEPLLGSLKDTSWHERKIGSRALRTIDGDKVIEPLTVCLHDEDWHVRRQTVEALEKIGKSTVPFLINALEDKDWGVRELAHETLHKITGEDFEF